MRHILQLPIFVYITKKTLFKNFPSHNCFNNLE